MSVIMFLMVEIFEPYPTSPTQLISLYQRLGGSQVRCRKWLRMGVEGLRHQRIGLTIWWWTAPR